MYVDGLMVIGIEHETKAKEDEYRRHIPQYIMVVAGKDSESRAQKQI